MPESSRDVQHEILSELAHAIARGEGVGATVERAGASLADVFGADFVWVAVARTGGTMEVLATYPPELEAQREPVPNTACLEGVIVERNRELRSPDAESDRRTLVRTLPPMVAARSFVIVPLSAPSGPIGVLAIGSATPSHFNAATEVALASFADMASIAVQTWLLRQRVRRSRTSHDGLVPANSAGAMLPRPRVSPREREVLSLLVGGKTYKEVAAVLDISTRTVEHHVERLKLRFHQPRLHGLVGFAIQNGLGQRMSGVEVGEGNGVPLS